MTNQTLNLFIIEKNYEDSLKLHKFLETRFGTVFNIYTFTDAVTAVSKVDENTKVVVLDYDYIGAEANEIIDFIKNINPDTEVIILSNHEEIFSAVDTYKKEYDKHIVKQKGARKKLSRRLFEIVTYPANYLQMKYSVSQFFIYLVFLFIVVGILVFFGMISIY